MVAQSGDELRVPMLSEVAGGRSAYVGFSLKLKPNTTTAAMFTGKVDLTRCFLL